MDSSYWDRSLSVAVNIQLSRLAPPALQYIADVLNIDEAEMIKMKYASVNHRCHLLI